MASNSFDQDEQQQCKRNRQFLVPEQGVRLAVTVPIFMMIGFYAFEELEAKMNMYVFTWALWCAMTMVLVSSNEMGGVMTDGMRRFSGALITGIMATAVVWLFKNYNLLKENQIIQSDAIIVALAGMVVMFFAQVFVQFTGYKRTTVMVCQLFIKCCFVGKVGNYYLVWSIIIGVCTGVLMISLTSVIIFPRSSSYMAMIKLKLALDQLECLSRHTMHELITASINPQNQLQRSEVIVSMDTFSFSEIGGQDEVAQLTQQMKLEDNTLRKCEDMMYGIYDNLDSMKQHLKSSKNEVYIGTRFTKEGPKWVLLPGAKIFRCLCTNTLPYQELEYVQYNIRRVARHLWAVLLSIDHMWDDTVQEVIKQRYPQEVLPQIHNLTTGVLKDIATAFPSQYYVSMKNLSTLEMQVEMMLNISNRWRTRATIKKPKTDPLVEQGRQRAFKRAATRANSIAKRTPSSIAKIMDSTGADLKPVVRTRSLAASGQSPGQNPGELAKRSSSIQFAQAFGSRSPAARTPTSPPAMEKLLEEKSMSFSKLGVIDKSSRTVRFSTELLSEQSSTRSAKSLKEEDEATPRHSVFKGPKSEIENKEDSDDETNGQKEEDEHSPFMGGKGTAENNKSPRQNVSPIMSPRMSPKYQRMGSIARLIFASGSLKQELDEEMAQQLLKPIEEEAPKPSNAGGGILRQLKKLASGKSRKNIQVKVEHGQRKKRRESVHMTGAHSADDVIQKKLLHQETDDIIQSQSDTLPNRKLAQKGFFSSLTGSGISQQTNRSVIRHDSIDVNSMIIDVPLVDEQVALSFPETEEGHTQEARWYSFQFQIDELLDALVELHTAVNNLLEFHLPKLTLTQNLIDRYQVRQYY